MVTVERFEPNPEHGRPRVAEFRGREGALAVHCDRETGALWLFASGPAGGDRGRVVVALRLAGELTQWLDDDCAEPFFGAGSFYIGASEAGDGDVFVSVGRLSWSRRWRMRFDAPAWDELLIRLREWATAAGKVG